MYVNEYVISPLVPVTTRKYFYTKVVAKVITVAAIQVTIHTFNTALHVDPL